MPAAHFSIERLARLEAKAVSSALAWLESRQLPSSEPRLSSLPRRALFACMVERSLPVPLDLLGIRSVLVIDDEPAVLRSISRVLRQAAPDLQILLAEGAKDGLARYAELSPDAVLVDAYMPEMTGVEVCLQLLRARPAEALTAAKPNASVKTCAVVAMTADPTPELHAAFKRAGAIAFLEKPVDAPALFEVLSAHLVPCPAGDS